MAEYLPLYAPGRQITRTASSGITAGNLVSVSGSGTVAATSSLDAAWVGVAAYDAATGDNVTIFSGGVQRPVAGTGGVTAGQLVHAGSGGTVVTHTNGTSDYGIVGVALSTAIAGATVEVQFTR